MSTRMTLLGTCYGSGKKNVMFKKKYFGKVRASKVLQRWGDTYQG